MNNNIRKFCVAPMMGYTTPHARKLYSMLSKKAFLFTEMIPTKTLVYSTKKNLIIKNTNKNNVALQVGGSDLNDLIKCSKIAEDYNYNEINLNVGCPSKAVQKGSFGACLMKDKVLVRKCLEVMKDSTKIEVSIKCRIGLGKEKDYFFFHDFIDEILKSKIKIVYVHARNAILNGLSPKNNRTIPSLDYSFIERIKKDYPDTQFILNGGIDNLKDVLSLSEKYDGVMVGRLIQKNPFILMNIDEQLFNSKFNNLSYKKIICDYFHYIKANLQNDTIYRLLSPILQIFFSKQNAKKFRTEIHTKMKNYQIEKLEKHFLDFVRKQEII